MQNLTPPHLAESMKIQETDKNATSQVFRSSLFPVDPLPRARFLDIVTLRDTDGEMISAATLTKNVIWQWNKVFQGEEIIKRCIVEIEQAESRLQQLDTMIAEAEEALRASDINQTGD